MMELTQRDTKGNHDVDNIWYMLSHPYRRCNIADGTVGSESQCSLENACFVTQLRFSWRLPLRMMPSRGSALSSNSGPSNHVKARKVSNLMECGQA